MKYRLHAIIRPIDIAGRRTALEAQLLELDVAVRPVPAGPHEVIAAFVHAMKVLHEAAIDEYQVPFDHLRAAPSEFVASWHENKKHACLEGTLNLPRKVAIAMGNRLNPALGWAYPHVVVPNSSMFAWLHDLIWGPTIELWCVVI